MAALVLFLALVLGASAAHKVWDRDRLRAATARLLHLTPAWAAPFAVAAAMVEAIAAVLVLAPSTRALGAWAAAGLWTIYGIVLGLARRRGEARLDCACSLGASHGGLGRLALARPAILAGLAVIVGAAPSDFFEFGPEILPAGLALFALYLAVGAFEALPPSPRGRAA